MALGFLEKILTLFSGENDLESSKKRLLKETAKEIARNKYSRFYKLKGEEIETPFAKFFYDVYKLVSPAQVFLQNAAKSEQLKQIVIESFMDKKLLDIQERLSKEKIEELAQKTPPKDLSRRIRDDLSSFISGMDSNRIGTIDNCYNLIMGFTNFVNFDYFFLLKKFDTNLTERNFTYQPKFEAIRAEYVTDDIKDFLELIFYLEPDQDWKTALRVLKNYKGDMDVIAADQWNKLLLLLRDIKRSRIFELMVRHIDKDPLWQPTANIPHEHIVDAYLQKKKGEAESTINNIVQGKKNAQIEQLAKTIFGSADVSRMKYYTSAGNEIFLRKGMDGFAHTQGLNYLKAFLLDYFKKDIRELCDLFLIRGQWSSQVLSQQMSEGFHEVMDISEKLLTFDEGLSEDGDPGARLKSALAKSDRDKSQAKYVRIILRKANNDAQRMINSSAQALIMIGKQFKNILEDYQKNPRELIINWKELELSSEQSLPARITEIYKKIYYFVQLMQFFAGPVEDE